MKKISKCIMWCMFSATFLAGCGSGNDRPSQTSQNNGTDLNPQGPIDYKMMITDLLKSTSRDVVVKKSQLSNKSLNSQTNDQDLLALAYTGVVANFNPYGNTAFSSLVTWVTPLLGSYSPTAPTNKIYQNELYLASNLENIQNKLSADNNYFFNYYQTESSSSESNAVSNYNNLIVSINNIYSNYTSNVLGAATGNNSRAESLPALSQAQIASLSGMSNPDSIASLLQNSIYGGPLVAAGTLTNSVCTGRPQYTYSDIVKSNIVASPVAELSRKQTYLTALLSVMHTQLLNQLTMPGQSIGQNYVDLIYQYNQELIQIYGTTLLALQQLYTMEASLNYEMYANSNYVSSLGYSGFNECSNASLEYLGNTPQSNFIDAQGTLTQLYANRINLLYQTISSYIVSDHPLLSGQASITKRTIKDYPVIESTIQAKTLSSYTAGQVTGQVIGGDWVASANLYQESEFTTYEDCSKLLSDGKILTSINCPSILPLHIIGYYDGESLTAYNSANVETVSVGGAQFNFGQYCNVEFGVSLYQVGYYDNGFMCNSSQSSNYYLDWDNNYLTLYNYNSTAPISSSYTLSSLQYPIAAANSKYQSFNVYVNIENNNANGWNLILSSGPTANPASLNNPSFIVTQTNPFIMYNSGLSEGDNGSNTATMQVTLNDGTFAQFYLNVSSIKGRQYISLGCPYNYPGYVTCSVSDIPTNSGAATLLLSTALGNFFTLYATNTSNGITGANESSETRAVYLGVN
ncbi:MAG: hypothetical protein K2Q03_08570 [Sphingobacteriaceae bacterium]|nr:hypothetical protein [Sphingobacteriaceae bacterium]